MTMMILMIIFLYLANISFFMNLFVVKMNNYNENLLAFFLLLWLIFSLIALILGYINLIVRLVKRNDKNVFKRNMILKIILIPWYVGNFYVWVIYFAAFLNPWLFIAAPLITIIGIVYTYIIMILSGINNLVFIVKSAYKKKIKYSAKIVVGIIFQFFFILDIVGSILLFIERNNISYNKEII